MSARLQDKVALVTGGAQGIGEACVRKLAAHGAKVVISDIQVDRGEVVASGGRAELADDAVRRHLTV